MASRIPLRAAFAVQYGSNMIANYSYGARLAQGSCAVTKSQIRSMSKAPSDPWRASWKDMQMRYVTLKGFEATCAGMGSKGLFSRSTASGYHDCAQAFLAAVQNGSSPGSTYLLDQPEFDAATIYETGCILHTRHPSLIPFASSMWASASGLGFHPATISLAGDLVKHLKFGKLPMMRRVESDFRRLVNEGKEANALAIEGLRLYRQERKNAQAVAMFKKALEIGGEEFSYKSKCDHGLGHIAHSEGRLKEAAVHLQKAYEVDPLGAGLLLGDVYASLDPHKARQVYFRTASYGEAIAWGRLADMELGMAMEAKDETSKREHELWAMEFQRLRDARRVGASLESN